MRRSDPRCKSWPARTHRTCRCSSGLLRAGACRCTGSLPYLGCTRCPRCIPNTPCGSVRPGRVARCKRRLDRYLDCKPCRRSSARFRSSRNRTARRRPARQRTVERSCSTHRRDRCSNRSHRATPGRAAAYSAARSSPEQRKHIRRRSVRCTALRRRPAEAAAAVRARSRSDQPSNLGRGHNPQVLSRSCRSERPLDSSRSSDWTHRRCISGSRTGWETRTPRRVGACP